MSEVRVGCIGTPAWCREAHIKNLLQISGVEIAAVWNRGADNLRKAKELLPESAKACVSAGELISNPAINGVIVCVPPHLNEEYVIPALRQGKHVLCEKPLSNTMQGCRRIVEAAQANRRILQVGFELRHSEFYREIQSFLHEDKIGRAEMIVFKSFSDVGWAYRDGTWTIDPQLSGGVMNSWGVHAFDLMNGFTGSEPKAVFGVGAIKVRTQTPNVDTASVILEYANGALATLLYCRFSPYGNDWELSIVGRKGKVDGFLNRREIHHHRADSETNATIRLAPYEGTGFPGALEQMRTFVRCIRTGEAVLTDGMSGLRATQTALAIHQSFKEGRRVSLDEINEGFKGD